MRKIAGISGVVSVAIVFLIAAYILFRGQYELRVATGSVSQSLCGAAFISKTDPDWFFAVEQRPLMPQIAWAVTYTVDREHGLVRAKAFGSFASLAVFRPGLGCVLTQGQERMRPAEGLDRTASKAASAGVLEPHDATMRAALDAAFAEPDAQNPRHTLAFVVMHEGKLVAERYAPGISAQTSLHVHSISKSITSALVGILVRQGQLKLEEPVPIAAWRSTNDARSGVTIDQLLRMDSGLPFDETADILSPANRMWMLEDDSAAFAERTALDHTPGTQWGYSNLGYQLLSRLIRDAGGGDCVGAQRFMRRELFDPLDMQSAVVDCDVAGTPLGSSHVYASARDIARFAQLYLDDGIVDGKRILPEHWVSYSSSQTLSTGYGAGFWLNLVDEGSVPTWDAPWGMPQLPRDMFYARGYLGQYAIIIPSEKLVVVRLGITPVTARAGIGEVTKQILAALHEGGDVRQ